MYYEMETCRAIRTDRWKYVARYPNGPFELYDMRPTRGSDSTCSDNRKPRRYATN